MDIYIETGPKVVFASAVDWPGYARKGKSDDEAVDALMDYGKRYASVMTKLGFKPPKSVKIVERVKGTHGTDFGVLAIEPKVDLTKKISPAEHKKLEKILKASWAAFDAAAKQHARKKLSVGPRGGGRDIAKMTEHVFEADVSYLSCIGARYKGKDMDEMREEAIARLARHVAGEPVENKRQKPPWSPRYYVRRAAWHALDHAWEIEDRAT